MRRHDTRRRRPHRSSSLRESFERTWPDHGVRRLASFSLAAAVVLGAVGTWAAAGRSAAVAAPFAVSGRPPGGPLSTPATPGPPAAGLPTAVAKVGEAVLGSAPPTGSATAPAPVFATTPTTPTTVKAASPALPLAGLPYGKGMWMWKPEQTDGGNVDAMVARALSVGLTHVYVRTGSSWDGFYAGPFLDQFLPAAHAAGIRVYGWDFPNFVSWKADVDRAVAAVRHVTPSGERLDGFAADIETPSEGTRITGPVAAAYGAALRAAVGGGYPLVAVVPRPSPQRATFPYGDVVRSYDAIAPMVYWLNREPGSDVAGAMRDLQRFGKPIFPVGQAYDGAPEGGRPGVPPRAELLRFLKVAHERGAAGVSFWSWQAANAQAWDAIRDAPQFHLPLPLEGLGRLVSLRL